MSWQLLYGSSRRPRVSWAVPEHLRDSARYGPVQHPAVPAPLHPDALLQYIDNAISIIENAQATEQLSPPSVLSVLPSSSTPMSASLLTSPPSSSSSAAVSYMGTHLPFVIPTMLSPRKISRFKSVPLPRNMYINSSLTEKCHQEATPASVLNSPAVLDKQGPFTIDSLISGSTEGQQSSQEEGVLKANQMSGKEEGFDAHAWDDAYRAACNALSEGNAELALSLLHIASAKCPPDKQSALGKVQRLMAAAMQLVEKNSAVLRPLPGDKEKQ